MERIFAIDIDGTLISDQGEISEEDKLSILSLAKNGVRAILATGKTLYPTLSIKKELKLRELIITDNGACVYNEDKLIYSKLIEPLALKDILNYSIEKNYFFFVFIENSVFTYKFDEFCFKQISDTEINVIRNISIFIESKRPSKIVFAGLPEEISRMKIDLSNKIESITGIRMVQGSRTTLDIINSETDKMDALNFVAKFYNISSDHLISIGDSNNDIGMIKGCNISIAMGNASEELKKHAKYVTVSNNQSGVAYAIKKFVLEGEVI